MERETKNTIMKSILDSKASELFLTSNEMADRIGISRSSYFSVLGGRKKLTLQEANTIYGEFDIPFEILAAAELGRDLRK